MYLRTCAPSKYSDQSVHLYSLIRDSAGALWIAKDPRLHYTDNKEPASVAQLDARPTGDQEVAGSTPAEVGNILSWRLIVKYFL